MRRKLSGSLVFDASTVLELLYSTSCGVILKDCLKADKVHGNVSQVTVAEVGYVLCRKLGSEEARTRVENLLGSGYVSVHEDSGLVKYVAEYKCRRRISLGDCFTLALAKKMDVPALFARREEELMKEASKEPLDVKILFLEDFGSK